MPRVDFDPLKKSAVVAAGETILDAARRAGAPVGNSCGAIGICARCRVRVVSGGDQLDAMTAIERQIAARRDFGGDERLACQAIVRGDCAVTTAYW